MMPKMSRRMKIIKINVEINEIKNKQTKNRKVNEIKSWFFKISIIEKPPGRLIRG